MIDGADPFKECLHLFFASNVDQLRGYAGAKSGFRRCQLGSRMARNYDRRAETKGANRDAFTDTCRTANHKNTFAFHKVDGSRLVTATVRAPPASGMLDCPKTDILHPSGHPSNARRCTFGT